MQNHRIFWSCRGIQFIFSGVASGGAYKKWPCSEIGKFIAELRLFAERRVDGPMVRLKPHLWTSFVDTGSLHR